MVTLKHDGFRKVREGLTSLEEVIQICGDISSVSEKRPAPGVAPATVALAGAASEE